MRKWDGTKDRPFYFLFSFEGQDRPFGFVAAFPFHCCCLLPAASLLLFSYLVLLLCGFRMIIRMIYGLFIWALMMNIISTIIAF
jgi:hypothetical protein